MGDFSPKSSEIFLGKYSPDYSSAYSVSFAKPRSVSVFSPNWPQNSTHFTLGSSKETLESESKSRYNPVQHSEANHPSQGDSYKHNFSFGFTPAKFRTTSTDYFKETPKFVGESFQRFLEQNRKTNFVFGNDFKGKNSVMKSDFIAKEGAARRKERENIRFQHKSTHFKVGELPSYYKTTSCEDYQHSNIRENSKSISQNQFAITLGTFKPDFITVKQQEYTSKPLNQQYSPTQSKNSMLTTNFKLGSRKKSKKSVSQESFYENLGEKYNEFRSDSNKNHFNLGFVKNDWKKKEKNEDQEKNEEKFVYPYTGSYVIMGYDSSEVNTTNKELFNQHNGVHTNKLNDFLLDDIKKQHFCLGFNQNEYETCGKKIGIRSERIEKTDDSVLKELKKDHIKMGSDNDELITSHMKEFTKKQTEKVKKVEKNKHVSVFFGDFKPDWTSKKPKIN